MKRQLALILSILMMIELNPAMALAEDDASAQNAQPASVSESVSDSSTTGSKSDSASASQSGTPQSEEVASDSQEDKTSDSSTTPAVNASSVATDPSEEPASQNEEDSILLANEVEDEESTEDEDPGTVFDVDSVDAMKKALDTINAGDGKYTINITADITMTSSITISKNTVNIIGNNHTLDFGDNTEAIRVNGGSSAKPVLILGKKSDKNNKLTLKSNGKTRNDGSHFIIVGDFSALSGNGTVKMYAGVTVQDAYTNNAFGGGVIVGNGGTFEMNGGTIKNCGIDGGSVCHGGGVAVISGGQFTMNGGTITKCFANSDTGTSLQATASGGGVYVGFGSTFTMNGGSIEDNTASQNGGGVMVAASVDSYYNNGGYGYLDSRFEMTGGTIKDNNADNSVGGGLAVIGRYTPADAICATNPSSGAPEKPGVYISGGTFEGNSSIYGGGILLCQIRGSIPVQIHGATLTGNDASYGGAICIYSYWTQADIDGCQITKNTAGQGAGIFMQNNSSGNGTTLKNSTITGNAADTKIGGGVYYDSNSKLTIAGENKIQDNTYNGTTNNLNILDKDHPVYVGGSLKGSSIGLSDPTLWNDDLTDEDSSAVSTMKLTSGFKENNAGIKPEDVFTSDHNTWVPDYGEKKDETYTTTTTNSTNVTMWDNAKVTDTIWVCPSKDVYKGQTQLYYNTKTKVFSTSSSGSVQVAMISKDNTYYLAYKVSNASAKRNEYYIIKEISEEPEATTFTLGGRNMTYDHFDSDLGIDGYDYIRTNDFSTATAKSLACYELVTEKKGNGDGYDYSNEVRLVRGHAIQYKDGDSDADFGSIEHPTVYKNNELTLVDPAEKDGYEFKGWYRDADFQDGPVTKLGADEKTDKNGNIVLYGKWVAHIDSDLITVSDLKDLVYNGKEQKQAPTVTTKDGTDLTSSDYTITYSAKNGDTDDDYTNAGTTITVTITGIGNYTGTVTKTYKITPKELTVTTYSATKYFDGKPLTAPGSIEGFVDGENANLKTTGVQLHVGSSENTYEIDWNDTTKESNYTVTEKSIGTLTVNKQSIVINPDSDNPDNPDFNPDDPSYKGVTANDPKDVIYDGKNHKFVPIVKSGDGILKEGEDYTLTYSTKDFKNPGKITVTITGIGNYDGVIVKTYSILKKDTDDKDSSNKNNKAGKNSSSNKDSSKKASGSDSSSIATGDSNNLLFYGIGLIAAVIAAAAVFFAKRKVK